MFYDLPLNQLRAYCPPRDEPADFDAFWAATLAEARQFPLRAEFKPVDFGLRQVEVLDVTFSGYGGQPIKGWLLLPSGATAPLPCLVEYIGYGGGRSLPYDHLLWSNAGYAHLVMDTRGQGSVWSPGDTPDLEPEGSNPQQPGFMTRGVLAPRTYYYRRLFTDAVRAVEAARVHPLVDGCRVAVTGGSQGGGIALAVSGLVPELVAALPDVHSCVTCGSPLKSPTRIPTTRSPASARSTGTKWRSSLPPSNILMDSTSPPARTARRSFPSG